jgi:CheY-like chemotaxis protein
VRLSVSDTGTGMTPETAARAFDPFYTTKGVGKGTGLGLSQVYGMVQQAGGDLVLASTPGAGTTVTMYFPATAAPAVEDGTDRQAAERVLIVDDQPEVLDMTKELFRTLGFEVLAANSGAEALDLLRRSPDVQLMLSDVVMPGMDGVQLAKHARSLVPTLKVILASGYVNPALDAMNQNLGGFYFLPKPYRMADLVRTLRSVG